MDTTTKRLVWTSWRSLITLAAPMVVASLSTVLIGIVDTAIVGHFSLPALAAVATAAAFYVLAAEIVQASAIGFQIEAARLFGGGRDLEVGRALLHSLPLTLCTAVMGAVLLWLAPIDAIASDEAVVQLAAGYLLCRLPGLPLLACTVLLRIVFDTKRETKWGMWTAIVSNVVNASLTYALVFGEFNLPQLGVVGAGIAATVGQAAGLAFLCIVHIRRKLLSSDGLAPRHFRWPKLCDGFRLSWPEMLNMGIDYAGNLVFVYLAGLLGTLSLAGSRIAFAVLIALFIVATNVGTAAQILLGRNLGAAAEDAEQVWRHHRAFLILSFAAIGLALLLAPSAVASLFSTSTALQAEAAAALQIVAATLPIIAWNGAIVAALRAFRRTDLVMISNTVGVWLVQLPAAMLFGIWCGYGLPGLYLGFLLYFSVRVALGHWFLRKNFTAWAVEEQRKVDTTSGRAARVGLQAHPVQISGE